MHTSQFFATFFAFNGCSVGCIGSRLLLLLLRLDGLICQVAKCGVAAQILTSRHCWLLSDHTSSTVIYQSADLLLKSVIVLLKLIILFFDSEMVLDLLSLIGVTNLHLCGAHTLKVFFESFLLVCKGLESQHDFLNFILALLKHFLSFPKVTVYALSFTPTL